MQITPIVEEKKLAQLQDLYDEIKAQDGFDVYSTIEKKLDFQKINKEQILILVDDDQLIGYGVSLRDWHEKDGTHVYLIDVDIKQEYRNKVIGVELLVSTEALCSQTMKNNSKNTIGVNATKKEQYKLNLYEDHGYKEVIRLVEMEMILATDAVSEIERNLV